MNIRWHNLAFKDLSPRLLYQVLAARQAVFVVEQYCPYQDADHLDEDSYHVLGMENDKLVAYARILPPGLSCKEMAIGRVLTLSEARGKGLGKALMKKAIEYGHKLYGKVTIRIGAQSYLQDFYSELGFTLVGKPYLEDGIPHVEMTHKP